MPSPAKRRKRRTAEEQIADLEKEIEILKARARQQKKFSPEELAEERERLELSQAHYAQLVGVSTITIGSWENGKTKPRAKQIESLLAVKGISKAKAWETLGLEEVELFTGDDVRKVRARLELSAMDFATLMGVSHLTIYAWEHGRSKPRKGQLEAWQRVRGLSKEAAWEELGLESGFEPRDVFADRKRLELSAADYAELVGVSPLTIYNWEKGKSKPQAKQLEKWLSVKGMGKRKAWKTLGY